MKHWKHEVFSSGHSLRDLHCAQVALGLGALRRARRVMHAISSVVLVTFTTMMLAPAGEAIAGELRHPQANPVSVQNKNSSHAQVLDDLKSHLHSLLGPHSLFGPGIDEDKLQLRKLGGQLQAENATALAAFAAVNARLDAPEISDAVKRRHADAVARFKAEAERLQAELQGIDQAPNAAQTRARAEALVKRLEGLQTTRHVQAFDPKHLPFGQPTTRARAPLTDAKKLADLLPAQEFKGNSLASLRAAAPSAGSPVTPDELAPTEDVQITPAITSLATQLNNSPVAIFNWVHDNIDFVPTYGSIQGSDATLQGKRGNAYDTASLLIALLRAANIPSRYVYGTIDVPVAQAMNWIGGVATPDAALQLLGQGGVPSTGLASGGVVTTVEMEHVWVEAFVDFVPSRGAKNVSGDTWVPMDAAFKQYAVLPSVLPANVTALVPAATSQYLASATVSANGAAATGFDYSQLSGAIANVQSQVATAAAANPNNVDTFEIIGGRAITPLNAPVLAASLPYHVAVRAQSYAALPPSLRVSAAVDLLTVDSTGLDGVSLISQTLSLPALGYGSLHLSNVPASPADAATWNSFISSGATSFPAYLINAKQDLTLNGTLLAEGAGVGLGTDLILRVTFSGAGQSAVATFNVAAGDDIDVGVNGSGQAPLQGLALKGRTDLGTAANNMFVVGKAYWTQQDYQDRLLATMNNAVVARLPSVGIFSEPLTVNYYFGVPRFGSYHARQVDVKLSRIAAVSRDGDPNKAAAFVLQSGMLGSSLEGGAVEEVIGKGLGSGSNTMRLLQLANQQLIPIYALNQTNLAANIGILQHSAQVLSDVQNAVGAGLEVVIPATAQTNGTWSGSGYIMLDPQTGAADYRISGGVSGNVSDDCNRSSKTIAVASLNVSIIWWLLLGWMVDDNDDFNGVAVATVLAAVVAVAIIIVVAAPAAAAVGGLVARAGAVISEAALTGALVAFSGAALANGGDTCSCTPMGLGYRRGGNAAHNACAAQPQNTDPPFAAEDVELGGKAFDGWLQSQNKLTEVKTGLFYTTIKNLSTKVPAKQAFLDLLLAKNVAEFYVDRVKSGFCNIDFGFAVTDGNLLNDMRGVLSTTGDAGRVYNNGC